MFERSEEQNGQGATLLPAWEAHTEHTPAVQIGGSRLQTLVAAVDQNVTTLASRMHLESDAVIINQCNEDARSTYYYERHVIRCVHMKERGVGLSRNTALDTCDSALCLFSDEDIVYRGGYAQAVCDTFDARPDADLIMFNIRQAPGRETYRIDSFGRVRWYNYGRYAAYSIAARTDRLKEAGVRFSLLFGGGARYSNGEDTLFLHDCLQKGLKIFCAPVLLGEETARESTWFRGYTDKFFYDRGVLYHHLYDKWAVPFGLRFLLKNKAELCAEKPFAECYALLKKGVAEAEAGQRESA